MEGKKKFGLVLPKKSVIHRRKTSSVFEENSDSEFVENTNPKIPQSKAYSNQALNSSLEDPSIYEYDSIYDDMKAEQVKEIASSRKKESRYINSLLKAADKRKKGYERRVEKKVQIEREKEGDQFQDKEVFVTSAYKKKMQEMEEEEEKERKENLINDMMDVTKQNDLSGFYRHFLKQTVGEEKVPLYGHKLIQEDTPSIPESCDNVSEKKLASNNLITKDSPGSNVEDNRDYDSNFSESSVDETITSIKCINSKHDYLGKIKQTYSESGDETVPDNCNLSTKNKNSGHEKLRKNSDTYELHRKKLHAEQPRGTEISLSNVRHDSSDDDMSERRNDDMEEKAFNEKLVRNFTLEEKGALVETEISKNRRNIFVKRTVGNFFNDAQARYFQRLAARCSKIL